jgi:hypothetical protein
MPVTFQPANHPAIPFPAQAEAKDPTATRILRDACPDQFKKCGEIFQTSLEQGSCGGDQDIIPFRNGFVDTIVQCYCDHRAVIIRPDDVWLAILTQFNFFVNGNAEQLKKQFVSHEGKPELEIVAVGNRYTVDFGLMARQMMNLIDENIVDPTLREWILPDFSTTTITDSTVSAMIMMATLKVSSSMFDDLMAWTEIDLSAAPKEYFSYKFTLRCGIPRVTLEGEKKDWENILVRLEKLKEYGDETTAWYHLLLPVISRFIAAFDNPAAQDNLDFWQKVCHYEGGGSGPTWIAGWINAFCVFDKKGKWVGYPIGEVRRIYITGTRHRRMS